MARQRSDSRNKIIEGACALLRRQGYHSTGLSQIVEVSGAPRGSMYFLFPGGKEEVAVAAVERSGADILDGITMARQTTTNARAWVAALLGHFAEALRDSDFTDGCPITTVALDSVPGSVALTNACRAAYDSWLAAIADSLASYGVPADKTAALATTILASLEGGLVLCRVQQSTEPLTQITDQMAALLGIYVDVDVPAR